LPAGFGRLGGGGMGLVTGGGGGGGGSILTGAPPRGGSDAAGRIPGVTDPSNTILGSMGNITGAIGSITAAQLEALRKQYPSDFFALQQMLLENAKRRAAGDISDLLPEMWQKNAEAAVGGGYSGSAMENTKRLRDMGLTRLGLEKGAEESMKNVFGATPTVKPYDPSSIIAGIIDAQNRADLYNAAPDPEAAYNRARNAARGAGGGGGGGGPGVRYGAGGGGGTSSVDDILKRYGSGLGGSPPPIIARGTRVGGLPDSDYDNVYQTGGPGWGIGAGGGGGGNMSVEDFDAFANRYGYDPLDPASLFDNKNDYGNGYDEEYDYRNDPNYYYDANEDNGGDGGDFGYDPFDPESFFN
jgi:hypothetical protein